MPKRKSRKKKNNFNVEFTCIILIAVGIFLCTLIYSNAGIVGQGINSLLGGFFGNIKYVFPIALIVLGIYVVFRDKESLIKKSIQYSLFLISIAGILHIFYYLSNVSSDEFFKQLQDAYTLGSVDCGGGVIGAAVAIPLTYAFGQTCSIVILILLAFVLFISITGIKISNIFMAISSWAKESIEEKKNTTNQKKVHLKEKEHKDIQENKNKGKFDFNQLEFDIDEKPKVEQVAKKEIRAQSDSKAKDETDILFEKQEVQKEDKSKEVLVLEHTITSTEDTYEFPPMDLLEKGKTNSKDYRRDLERTALKLQRTLASFGVEAKVINVSKGPTITRYELQPKEGVKVSKIAGLSDDIALNLAATSIRIEAPIPGKAAVGIEIPNETNDIVHFREIIDTDKFKDFSSKLAFGLGKDIAGESVVTDIAKMPHVLIAGSTGSGKSVCINTLISSILYKAKPSEVKLLMVDPKVVELGVYNGIPHLLIPVVTDPKKAAGALNWAVQEMVNRYNLFASKGVRDIKGYNEAILSEGKQETLPHIVIIIDELADLMMVAPNDVEDAICRLAQMARAAGMHLVIATQRPSVDVITGVIKANIPSRIAFAVSSQVDSRTILDMSGAEKLLGKGDMLFYPLGANKPKRIQGAFITDKEVEAIVDYIKSNSDVKYNEDIIEKIDKANKTGSDTSEDEEYDELLPEAIELAIETGQASTSFIQRRFKVGYARAGRIIDQMEQRGIISGYEGSKPRQVLITKEQWAEQKMQASGTSESV